MRFFVYNLSKNINMLDIIKIEVKLLQKGNLRNFNHYLLLDVKL